MNPSPTDAPARAGARTVKVPEDRDGQRLDNFLLGQLKGGKNATFIVFQTPEEGVGVPVSLNGFGPGVEALP